MKPATLYFWGILLILFGIELHSVETFYLSPAISSAIGENIGSSSTKAKIAIHRSFQSIFQGAAFDVPPYPLTPPSWLGWPFFCVGIVCIVQAASKAGDK